MTKSELNKWIKIAVLPFEILGGNESLRPLMIGFTDDLITDLSKFVGLLVISRYSTAALTDLDNPTQIERLGANFLVTGSVRQHNDQLRITIKLIRSEDMSVVFAGKHNTLYSELLDIQDAMIQEIVGVLQGEINYNLLSHSYKKKSVDLKTYENWLRGKELLKKGTVESDEEARTYFQAAIDNDPQFAMAYAGMSLTYFNEWSCQLWDRWDISKKGAHEYALKAIEIDENDYTALAVLGRTYLYQEEYGKAEHYARKALRMNPNDAYTIILVSYVLMYLGYHKESLTLYEKARDLNPLQRDNYLVHGVAFNMECGNFEEAKELVLKLDLRKSWIDYPVFAAAVYFHLEDLDSMWKCWNTYLDLYKNKVFNGEGDMETAALNWQIEINPFVGSTNLQPLWNFVRKQKNLGQHPKAAPTEKNNAAFQYRNELWELKFDGKQVILNDAKGLHDLHKLLSKPHTSFNCLDLMGAVVDEHHKTTTIDKKAKQDYMTRIKELQEAIEDAEMNNMNLALDELRTEYDTLLDHLSSAVGLKGKARGIGSTIEKARSAVTWRIRAAIKKIEKVNPELAKHFSATIKTGTNCSYSPENQIDWLL